MLTKIVMPQLGTTMTEGILEKWLKNVGDEVAQGEAVAAISTDKYETRIEAESAGYLSEVLVEEGSLVPVLTPLAILSTERGAPMTEKNATPDEIPRLYASPLAKATAKRLGVRLEDIPKAPARTRIKQADVTAYAKGKGEDHRAAPLTAMRRAIANAMITSAQAIPQVTLMAQANASNMLALRAQYNRQGAVHVTVNDILVKAAAQALAQFPQMNGCYTDGGMVVHEGISVGIAVAVEEGLVVPVIECAHQLSVAAIALRTKALVEGARAGQMMEGSATFTVSNLGMYGVSHFTPLVTPGQLAILGVGECHKMPVFDDMGQVAAADMISLSLSFDHRGVDGALAAQFLGDIVSRLENPAKMLFEQ